MPSASSSVARTRSASSAACARECVPFPASCSCWAAGGLPASAARREICRRADRRLARPPLPSRLTRPPTGHLAPDAPPLAPLALVAPPAASRAAPRGQLVPPANAARQAHARAGRGRDRRRRRRRRGGVWLWRRRRRRRTDARQEAQGRPGRRRARRRQQQQRRRRRARRRAVRRDERPGRARGRQEPKAARGCAQEGRRRRWRWQEEGDVRALPRSPHQGHFPAGR